MGFCKVYLVSWVEDYVSNDPTRMFKSKDKAYQFKLELERYLQTEPSMPTHTIYDAVYYALLEEWIQKHPAYSPGKDRDDLPRRFDSITVTELDFDPI